jgi:hypothetical protein
MCTSHYIVAGTPLVRGVHIAPVSRGGHGDIRGLNRVEARHSAKTFFLFATKQNNNKSPIEFVLVKQQQKFRPNEPGGRARLFFSFFFFFYLFHLPLY